MKSNQDMNQPNEMKWNETKQHRIERKQKKSNANKRLPHKINTIKLGVGL